MDHREVAVDEDALHLEAGVGRAVELRRQHLDRRRRAVRDGRIVLAVVVRDQLGEGIRHPLLRVEELHEPLEGGSIVDGHVRFSP